MCYLHQCTGNHADLALWPSCRLSTLLCQDHSECCRSTSVAAALRHLSGTCEPIDIILGQLAYTGVGQQLLHGCQKLGLSRCARRRCCRLGQLVFHERCAQRASSCIPSAHTAHGGRGATSLCSAAWCTRSRLAIRQPVLNELDGLGRLYALGLLALFQDVFHIEQWPLLACLARGGHSVSCQCQSFGAAIAQHTSSSSTSAPGDIALRFLVVFLQQCGLVVAA